MENYNCIDNKEILDLIKFSHNEKMSDTQNQCIIDLIILEDNCKNFVGKKVSGWTEELNEEYQERNNKMLKDVNYKIKLLQGTKMTIKELREFDKDTAWFTSSKIWRF